MDSMKKMIIKLKIPDEVRLECPACPKCFSSVKALGGHKRIHKRKRNHEDMELHGGEKTLIPCPLCHQAFTSEKSLHGHMRKHPERGWRGMRPPPQEDDHEAVSGARVLLALASAQPPRLLQDKGKSAIGENSSLLLNNNEKGDHFHPLKSQNNYPCEICGKSFRSYQALGGHKSHHSGKSALRLYMEQPERFGGGEEGNGDQPAKLVFDFDLNEFPKW